MLKNAVGDQRLVGLTGGWTEVARVEKGTGIRESAREHLDEICNVAKRPAYLRRLTGHRQRTPHVGYWINRQARTARCYEC